MEDFHILEFNGEGAAGFGSAVNPQFFLDVKSPHAKVSLAVKMQEADALCFWVQKVNNNAHGRRVIDFGDDGSPNRVHTSKFVAAKEIAEEVTFNSPGAHVVLVMTNKAGVEGDVSLEVGGKDQKQVVILGGAEYRPERASIQFDAEMAYGSAKNPQVLVHVKEKCSLGITLTCPGASATRFFVNRCPSSAPRRLLSFPQDDEARVCTSSYTAAPTVSAAVSDLAPGHYVILSMQQEKGRVSPGEVVIHSDAPRSFDCMVLSSSTKKKTLQFNKDCGGYGSSRNPQFVLSLTRASDVNFDLKCASAGVEAVRFYVQRAAAASAAAERLREFPEDAAAGRAFTSKYVSAASLSETVKQLPAGQYAILAHTKKVLPDVCDVTLSVEAADDPSFTLDGKNFLLPQQNTQPCSFETQLQKHKRVTVDVAGTISENILYDTWEDACAVVDAIEAEYAKGGKKTHFVDPDMPHNESSISGSRAPALTAAKNAQWRRLSYFAPDVSAPPAFFVDDEDNFDALDDAVQGQLSNCWMTAVAASVSTRAELVRKLFYPATPTRSGALAVRFVTNGRARGLVLDDFLPEDPAKPARLIFGHSSCPSEFWFALLEKAFAKFVGGSYNYLAGGFQRGGVGIKEAFELVTGGLGKFIHVGGKGGKGPSDCDWFLQTKEAVEKNWLVTTQTIEAPGGGGGGSVSEAKINPATGLVYMHAYSVIDAVEDGDLRLLQLRNTWGAQRRGESTLDFCDGSSSWNKVSPNLRARCGQEQQQQQKLSKKSSSDDGIFWIRDLDFEKNFTALNFTSIIVDELPHQQQIDLPEIATPLAETSNLVAHRQYLLQTATPGAILDVRILFVKKCKSSLRMLVAPASSNQQQHPLFIEAKDCESTKYVYESVTLRKQLDAAQSAIVITPQLHPKQSEHGAACPARILVHSSAKIVSFRELPLAKRISCDHAFTPASYQSDENPRLRITVGREAGPTSLLISLVAENREDKQGMQLALAQVGKGTMRHWPKEGHEKLVQQTQYLAASHLDMSVAKPLEPGDYVLWATLQRPTQRNFRVTILAQSGDVSMVAVTEGMLVASSSSMGSFQLSL